MSKEVNKKSDERVSKEWVLLPMFESCTVEKVDFEKNTFKVLKWPFSLAVTIVNF